MQLNENYPPFTTPQHVYDWYNAHYDNHTYRAFRAGLTESAQYGRLSEAQTNTDFIDSVMNLLIDASFNRISRDLYPGAEARLMAAIDHLDSRITTLARLHLTNFDQ